MTEYERHSIANPLKQLVRTLGSPLPARELNTLVLALVALHRALDGKLPSASEVISSMQAVFSEHIGQEANDAASKLCRQVGELTLSRLLSTLSALLRHIDPMALDVDTLWSALNQGGDRSGFELPPELIELMFQVLPMPPVGSDIYLPWDETGQFLEKAGPHRLVPHAEVLTPGNLAIMQLISYVTNGEQGKKAEVRSSDPIKHPSYVIDGKPRHFDACIALPPIGLNARSNEHAPDLYDRFEIIGAQYHNLAIQHVLWQTRGAAALLVSHGMLFSAGADRQLREHLLRSNVLRAVIGLPQGLLAKTQIPLAILLLNNEQRSEEVLLVNAEHPDFSEEITRQRKRLINISALTSIIEGTAHHPAARRLRVEELLDGESNLVPSRHILSEQASRAAALVDQMPTRALGELSTIIRPAPAKEKVDVKSIQAYEIGVADLAEHGYITTPSRAIQVSEIDEAKIMVRPLDVLLSIKGANRKVGVVPLDADSEISWVIGQSVCIIRCDTPKLAPKVLAMFLRSQLGQQLLNQITTGSTIPFVQLKELRNLQVPIPDAVEQRKIAGLFDQQVELIEEIRGIESRIDSLVPKKWSL